MALFIKKTPRRLQIDPIECGAVCLGIILEYLGHYVTNVSLRQACSTSRHGSDAAAIIRGATVYGLFGQAKKMLATDLKKARTPAILFFDQCHFVVFEGYSFGRYYVNDPARGRYSLVPQVFHERFSKIAIFFSYLGFKAKREQEEPHHGYALAKMTLILLGIFAGVIYAMLAASAGFFLSGSQKNLALHGWDATLGFITLILLATLSLVTLWQIIAYLANHYCLEDTKFLTMGLINTPASFFEDVPFEAFIASFSTSINRFLLYFRSFSYRYFFSSFFIVLMLATIFMFPLSILMLALTMLLFICQHYGAKVYLPPVATTISDRDLSRAISLSSDMTAMGQEEFLLDGLLKKRINLLPRLLDKNSLLASLLFSPVITVASLLILLSVFLPPLWHHGDISLAEVFSTILLGLAISYSMAAAFSWRADVVHDEALAFKRELREQLKAKEKIIETPDEINLVQLKNVNFAYRGEKSPVFHQINLTIKRGQTVGIVGPTLAGTSTLMRLIGGAILQSEGNVIHGIVNAQPLRIALIDDDADVMAATLKDTITLFDQTIHDEQVVKALQNACGVDLFYNRPFGLMAPIEAHGKNVSDSEKKRILLAQALAHKPDLIILDDVFASLDETVAIKILHNLKEQAITTIFNSWRLSELGLCDAIVLINKNAPLIVDRHDHLLKTNELYQNLISTPLAGDGS